ncbi:uncharacterized protein METZ01_LOCUS217034, partial [marine metagenome]
MVTKNQIIANLKNPGFENISEDSLKNKIDIAVYIINTSTIMIGHLIIR